MRSIIYWLVLLLILLALVATVTIVAEYALRYLYPNKVSMFQSDSVAISLFKKNLVRTGYGKNSINIRTNAYGIRDDGETNPIDADVLVFGDSNIAAMFLPFEETLGPRLEEQFDPGIVVANMGVPGDGPDQSLQRYLQIAGETSAKALVFHVFADNDFGDMFRNNIYREQPDGEWRKRDKLDRDPVFPVNRSLLLRGLNKLLYVIHSPFTLYDLIAEPTYYSPLHYGLLPPRQSDKEDSIETWRAISRQEFEIYKVDGYTSWGADHYDYALAASPNGEMATTARELLTHVLSQARSAFHGKQECFVILIQPSEHDLWEDGPSVANSVLRARYQDYYPKALSDLATRAADDASVSYINLYELFSGSPGEYYFTEEEKPGDNHWNAAGIASAATLLAAHFRKHECLETGRAETASTMGIDNSGPVLHPPADSPASRNNHSRSPAILDKLYGPGTF